MLPLYDAVMPVSLASFFGVAFCVDFGATLCAEELSTAEPPPCELPAPPMMAMSSTTTTTMMTQNHHCFQIGFLGFGCPGWAYPGTPPVGWPNGWPGIVCAFCGGCGP